MEKEKELAKVQGLDWFKNRFDIVNKEIDDLYQGFRNLNRNISDIKNEISTIKAGEKVFKLESYDSVNSHLLINYDEILKLEKERDMLKLLLGY